MYSHIIRKLNQQSTRFRKFLFKIRRVLAYQLSSGITVKLQQDFKPAMQLKKKVVKDTIQV